MTGRRHGVTKPAVDRSWLRSVNAGRDSKAGKRTLSDIAQEPSPDSEPVSLPSGARVRSDSGVTSSARGTRRRPSGSLAGASAIKTATAGRATSSGGASRGGRYLDAADYVPSAPPDVCATPPPCVRRPPSGLEGLHCPSERRVRALRVPQPPRAGSTRFRPECFGSYPSLGPAAAAGRRDNHLSDRSHGRSGDLPCDVKPRRPRRCQLRGAALRRREFRRELQHARNRGG